MPRSHEREPHARPLGGVVHTYQKYDPVRFPHPADPQQADVVSTAFDHLMMYGSRRRLTEEELAQAIRIDPRDNPWTRPQHRCAVGDASRTQTKDT